MLKKSWVLMGAGMWQLLAAAQTLPNAGAQLQQLPPAPVRSAPGPQLQVTREASGSGVRVDAKTFTAQRLVLEGASAYAPHELLQMAGFTPGQPMNLQILYGMAERITRRYRADGYLVAQAYIPA